MGVCVDQINLVHCNITSDFIKCLEFCEYLSYYWLFKGCSSWFIQFMLERDREEVWGFQSIEGLDCGLLDYNTVYSGRWLQVFLRNLLPPSSCYKMEMVDSFETVNPKKTTHCHNRHHHCLNKLENVCIMWHFWHFSLLLHVDFHFVSDNFWCH